RLASKILRNKIDEVLRLDDDTSIIEFEIPEAWIGKLLTNLDLRRKYEINLIGQRSERGENLTGINIAEPLPEDVILVGIRIRIRLKNLTILVNCKYDLDSLHTL